MRGIDVLANQAKDWYIHSMKTQRPFPIGSVFKYLTVISAPKRLAASDRARVFYRVRCNCGAELDVIGKNLKNGNTRSCGCLRKDTLTQHGATKNYKMTLTYRSWADMIKRCTNPNTTGYKNYGGRGIKICESWYKFSNFLKDMGERPEKKSIDRIDNNGPYCKENCRWATRSQQNRNTRQNHLLNFQEMTLCLADWADRTGIPAQLLSARLKLGWSTEDVLMTPINSKERGNRRFLSFNGRRLCVSEWARITGIRRETINQRLKHGWSVEEALCVA